MIFLEKNDFAQVIRLDILDNLTEGIDSKLDIQEGVAMDEVYTYLGNRYDLQAEYSKTGDDRNKTLLYQMINLMLYKLYGVKSSRDIPMHIEDNHKYAIRYLKGVRDGVLSTTMQLLNEDEGRKAIFLSQGKKYSRPF